MSCVWTSHRPSHSKARIEVSAGLHAVPCNSYVILSKYQIRPANAFRHDSCKMLGSYPTEIWRGVEVIG